MIKLNTKKYIGKTVDEAVKKALDNYSVSNEEMSFNVIQEHNKGFLFGIGSKPAEIETYLNENYLINKVKEFIDEIMVELDENISISLKFYGKTLVIFLDGEGLGKIIGKHGRTLGALQHLIMIFVNRMTDTKIDIKLDIGEYRKKRRKNIEEIADNAAKNVLVSSKTIELAPMFSFERKTVHEYIRKKYPELKTSSKGLEPYRKVVVFTDKKVHLRR